MADPHTPGLINRLPAAPRKVVVVRASRIGDFLLATPAMRALRRALPEAEFTFVGLPFVRDLVMRSPDLDHYVEFPGYPGLAEQFFEPQRTLRFFERMQDEEFDLAIQLNGSGVYSNPFTLMLGAKVTAGFIRDTDPPGRLDAALPFPDQGHEIQRVLSLAEFMGAEARGQWMECPLWPEDHALAETLLSGAESPLIGLHPGAREETKRWPAERFAALADDLQRRYGGTVVVVGGPGERDLAGAVADGASGPCINLAGATSLPGLGAVIARMAVLVTNDSGPAHMAYALRVPTVTIFGATDPARWGPPTAAQHAVVVNKVPCWPCDYWQCPVGYGCLQGITVAEVAAAAARVIRP